MNIYDIEETILCNHIKELLNETNLHKIKQELNQILDSLDNNNNVTNNSNYYRSDIYLKENILKIITYIKSPYQLLHPYPSVQNSFLKSPSLDHPIFSPIIINLQDLNRIIQNIENSNNNNNDNYKIIVNKLNQLYSSYNKSIQFYIDYLYQVSRDSIVKPAPDSILKSPAIVFTEDLNQYQVKSLELSYDIISYNPVEHEFQKRNEKNYNNGSIINNKICFKVTRNGSSLNPLKEYAVYQLYKLLYPLSKSIIISPTQLLVLDQLEVLSSNNKQERGELNRLKLKYGTTSTEKVLENETMFGIKLEHVLQNSSEIFTQASSFIKGITLKEYLEQCKINNDINYSQIDLESFSSHILSSLLLNQIHYKADDLILQNGTNKIIVIDNSDQFLLKCNNILFTLTPLMSKPIHQDVKDQFIQHNPSIFIIKWLVLLEKKNLNYYSLISKIFQTDTQLDKNSKEINDKIRLKSLNLPFQLLKGLTSTMYQRFKSIKQLLLQNPNISHQELLNEINPFSNSDQILLKNYIYMDSIKEFIQVTDYNDLLECKICSNSNNCINNGCENSNKTKSIIFEWLELVFLVIDESISEIEFVDFYSSRGSLSRKGSDRGDIIFHKSWYEEKYSILKLYLSRGSSVSTISKIIKTLDITINDDNFISIINQNDIINNNNIQHQVKFLVNHFKLLQDNDILLDLALKYNSFNFFIHLLELGADRIVNISLINRFYQNLSNEKKLLLKPYLSTLFIINPQINWRISLNQLFPLSNDNNNNSQYLISVTNSTKRIISNEIYNQLFDELTGEPKKSNILIKDDFGNGIYIKFKPQSPGTEIAINYLYKQLFNSNLTPYCELVSINNIPVLLIQQIPGEPLIDIIERGDKDILDKIDKSNISKQLIMAMLTNNSSILINNSDRFILVHNKIKDNYLLYPIVPVSISQISLQDKKSLFFFNQLNDPVHQDVINCFKNLDYYNLFKIWLSSLQHYHQLSSNYFKSTKEQSKDIEASIGISFSMFIIYELYSKIQCLKQLFTKELFYTHMTILNAITGDKEIIKTQNLSKIANHSIQMIKLRDSPHSIQYQLWNDIYDPAQALKQLDLLYKNSKIQKNLNESSFQYYIRTTHIRTEYDLKLLLSEKTNIIKVDFRHISSLSQELFNYIKSKEISIINLYKCKEIEVGIIKQFNLDFIVKLDLSGCSRIINFEDSNSKKLYFKSLIKIKFNYCSNLISIKIEAPNLLVISAQHCKLLKILEINSTNTLSCNLIGTISTQNIQTLDILNNYTLEYLDISESNLGEEVTIKNVSIKYLAMNSMGPLRKINLEVPVIESFSIEGCQSLNEISTIRNDQDINNNLWNILMSKDINYFKANNISINMAAAKQVYNLNKFNDFIMLVPNDSAFLIPPNTTCRFYYKVPTNFTFKSRIPKNILSLSISGDLPQQLYEEKLPNSIKYLQLYDTKMVNTNDLKLEYLFLGYGIKNRFNIGFYIDEFTSLNNNEVLNPLYYFPADKVIKEYNIKIESDNLVNFIYFYNTKSRVGSSIQKHLVIYNFNNGYIFKDKSHGEFRYVLLEEFDKDDTIPNSNNSVCLDLKSLYEIFSISSFKPPVRIFRSFDPSVHVLQCLNGYNQPIISGIIPSTITSLYLREVNYPLSIGSIPTSVTHLELCDGFNQEITKEGIIPNSVSYLFVGNIKYSLNKNSIPKQLKVLEFGINFKFDSLSTSVIPNTLQQLIIFEPDNNSKNYNYFNSKVKSKLSLFQNILIIK